MRVMVIIKADKNSEAGVLPDEWLLAAMTKFNEELVDAGVMLAGDGLHPSSKGAREHAPIGRLRRQNPNQPEARCARSAPTRSPLTITRTGS